MNIYKYTLHLKVFAHASFYHTPFKTIPVTTCSAAPFLYLLTHACLLLFQQNGLQLGQPRQVRRQVHVRYVKPQINTLFIFAWPFICPFLISIVILFLIFLFNGPLSLSLPLSSFSSSSSTSCSSSFSSLPHRIPSSPPPTVPPPLMFLFIVFIIILFLLCFFLSLFCILFLSLIPLPSLQTWGNCNR